MNFPSWSRKRTAGLVAASVVAIALPALASHWGGGYKRPDAYVPIWYGSMLGEFQSAVSSAVNNSYNPTDLNMVATGSPAGAEIQYVHGYYGDTGWYGVTTCQAWNGVYCGYALVQLNRSYGPYTNAQKRHLACHETGHAVGLNHSPFSASCLGPGWSEGTNGHDRDAINSHY